jgi:hypothetical protein
MDVCILYSESNKLRSVLKKNTVLDRTYKSMNLKRACCEPDLVDPCYWCLVSSICINLCDEKHKYLWE